MFIKATKLVDVRLFLLRCFFASVMATSLAQASVTTASITQVLVWSAGSLVCVYPMRGIAGPPACGASLPYYSFSYSRPMASVYLAAQARGAIVEIWGLVRARISLLRKRWIILPFRKSISTRSTVEQLQACRTSMQVGTVVPACKPCPCGMCGAGQRIAEG
jgi:hypothetical protein